MTEPEFEKLALSGKVVQDLLTMETMFQWARNQGQQWTTAQEQRLAFKLCQ